MRALAPTTAMHSLITFIERYEQTSAIDRYVLVNFLGDGRALKGPRRWPQLGLASHHPRGPSPLIAE